MSPISRGTPHFSSRGVRSPDAGATQLDLGRPTAALPRFNVRQLWDADSTPAALATASRAAGTVAPRSGARTPEIEAGVVLASLMHDVAYYYGGTSDQKARADRLFGEQIPYFVSKLDPGLVGAARITSMIDVAAVKLGGGVPFNQSYSWAYGFSQADRGYTTLAPDEAAKIQNISRDVFRTVVNRIANGSFVVSGVLQAKLDRTDPRYQQQLLGKIKTLAKALQAELKSDDGNVAIPGF